MLIGVFSDHRLGTRSECFPLYAGTVDDVINDDVLTRLYETPIHVARLDGRIYVTARDGDLVGHGSAAHDHGDGGS